MALGIESRVALIEKWLQTNLEQVLKGLSDDMETFGTTVYEKPQWIKKKQQD